MLPDGHSPDEPICDDQVQASPRRGRGRDLEDLRPEPDDAHALASALAELLADPERRKKLSLKGREVAKTRTWAALMQRYVRVYEQAMRESYRAS